MANEWGKTPQGATVHAYKGRATQYHTSSLCGRSTRAENITYADAEGVQEKYVSIPELGIFDKCDTCRKKDEAENG